MKKEESEAVARKETPIEVSRNGKTVSENV